MKPIYLPQISALLNRTLEFLKKSPVTEPLGHVPLTAKTSARFLLNLVHQNMGLFPIVKHLARVYEIEQHRARERLQEAEQGNETLLVLLAPQRGMSVVVTYPSEESR